MLSMAEQDMSGSLHNHKPCPDASCSSEFSLHAALAPSVAAAAIMQACAGAHSIRLCDEVMSAARLWGVSPGMQLRCLLRCLLHSHHEACRRPSALNMPMKCSMLLCGHLCLHLQ